MANVIPQQAPSGTTTRFSCFTSLTPLALVVNRRRRAIAVAHHRDGERPAARGHAPDDAGTMKVRLALPMVSGNNCPGAPGWTGDAPKGNEMQTFRNACTLNPRLRSGLAALLLLAAPHGLAGDETARLDPRPHPVRVEIDNPYATVDWTTAQQIRSTTHIHLTDQAALHRAARLGYRHLPVSNYYPSTPYYPMDAIRAGQFRVRQDFGAVRTTDGQSHYVAGPLDWNALIMDKTNGWYDSLPEAQREQLPFTVGDFLFQDIPQDLVFSPNAEHHAFANTGAGVHINAPGSLYSSGTFDAHNRFRTSWGGGGYSYGVGLPWQTAFALMLKQLLFADGGGITINHPHWSGKDLPQALIEEMLDFDPRVLGIEVLNSGDWDLEMWDRLLQTGRRCLGFFVPDWQVQADAPRPGGFNILLVHELTERHCLQAYRRGAFFGSQFGGDELSFQGITLKDYQLTIETSAPSDFVLVTDQSRSTVTGTNRVVFTIPTNAQRHPAIKYVRVEARHGPERIFSQPIRFLVRTE